MQRGKIALFLLFFGLASLCHAETAMVPSWLPADQRFEVEGTSNEIAQVDHTLALMRDALHPKLRAQMGSGDLGRAINWIVHLSMPGVTNEESYIASYKSYRCVNGRAELVLPANSFNVDILTNRASRLSMIPPSVKLSLLYDDGSPHSPTRPLPGVDYPGVNFEDEGSVPSHLNVTLRLPKHLRAFPVGLEVVSTRCENKDVEFKWVKLVGRTGFVHVSQKIDLAHARKVWADFYTTGVDRDKPCVLAVFPRVRGGAWGIPAIIEAKPDPCCTHHYASGNIEHIDYGDYCDWYKLDGRNKIIGFERIPRGAVKGARYSNIGEMILEGYSDDRPKRTRKVNYSMSGGKLLYNETDAEVEYNRESIVRYRNLY